MLQLKERWVECTTYTRCSQKFEVPQSAVPPIMAPSMRRPVLLNTEHKKKSIVLESLKQKYTGLFFSNIYLICYSLVMNGNTTVKASVPMS